MSLLYTDVEEELRAAVRALLTARCAPLTWVESGAAYDAALWSALARDIGAAGLLIPEEYGGAGASAREAAVVLEELGRGVAPVPFLTSAVLATGALLAAGHTGPLAELAAGELTAALAVPLTAAPYRPVPQVRRDGDVLTGEIRGVAGAEAAGLLLVPAGGALYAVRDFTVETRVSLDLTRPVATVRLAGAPGERIAGDLAPVRHALRTAAGLLASEQLGVAEWCLAETVAYLKERRQFARPVGSFQALKHRLADLWLELAQARAAARAAADALAKGEDVELTVAVAQAWCAEVAVHAAEEAVQLHGGIGMTWEHPVHLYLKRAKAAELAFGTPGDHHDALAVLADLPAPG